MLLFRAVTLSPDDALNWAPTTATSRRNAASSAAQLAVAMVTAFGGMVASMVAAQGRRLCGGRKGERNYHVGASATR